MVAVTNGMAKSLPPRTRRNGNVASADMASSDVRDVSVVDQAGECVELIDLTELDDNDTQPLRANVS